MSTIYERPMMIERGAFSEATRRRKWHRGWDRWRRRDWDDDC